MFRIQTGVCWFMNVLRVNGSGGGEGVEGRGAVSVKG